MSLKPYEKEEVNELGSKMYGQIRHDSICDYFEAQGYNESQVNDISMGIWKGIESERELKNKIIDELLLALNTIVDEDFRGNRPHSFTIAFSCLKNLGLRK